MRKCIRCPNEYDDGLSRYCPECRTAIDQKESVWLQSQGDANKVGFISSSGILSIKRASEMKQMVCIFSAESFCGDSCPHFGEVVNNTITICQDKCLEFNSLDDGRV